jgi:hypothetical protein
MFSRLKLKNVMYWRSYTLIHEFVKRTDYWVFSLIMVGDLQKYIYKLVYEIEPPYAWKKHLSRRPLCGLL